jgi:hypothetical protein
VGKKVICFELNSIYSVFIVPTITVSQNEKGAELCTQGISIAFFTNFIKEFSFCGKLGIKDI